MGRAAVIEVGRIAVLATERPAFTFDPALYRSVGLEPRDAKIVVVKSPLQFRDGYGDFARACWVVDTPGPEHGARRAARLAPPGSRPLFPFEDDFEPEIRAVVGPAGARRDAAGDRRRRAPPSRSSAGAERSGASSTHDRLYDRYGRQAGWVEAGPGPRPRRVRPQRALPRRAVRPPLRDAPRAPGGAGPPRPARAGHPSGPARSRCPPAIRGPRSTTGPTPCPGRCRRRIRRPADGGASLTSCRAPGRLPCHGAPRAHAPGARHGSAARSPPLLLLGPGAAWSATFRVDSERTRLAVQLYRAGVGSRLAHDHVVEATEVTGRVEYDADSARGELDRDRGPHRLAPGRRARRAPAARGGGRSLREPARGRRQGHARRRTSSTSRGTRRSASRRRASSPRGTAGCASPAS